MGAEETGKTGNSKSSSEFISFQTRPARIRARIMDEKEGFRTLEKVLAIRIHSRDYNVLIMDEFAPMLGRVEGDVDIVMQDDQISYRGIVGFYKHQRNEFTLLVAGRKEERVTAEQ